MTDRWIVKIGAYFLAGIGQTYKGYGSRVGFVLTKKRDHAYEFSSKEEAQKSARGLGGQVRKV